MTKREQQGVQEKSIRGVFERPRGSGVWWINYYDADGIRHREKVGRRQTAEDAYIERRLQVREGKFFAPRLRVPMTFRQLAEKRMAAQKLRLAERSYRTDELRLARLNAAIGEMPARKVSADAIEKFLRSLLEAHEIGKGKKPRAASKATVNRYRSLLSSIFSHGLRAGLVDKNPVKRVPRMREAAGRVRFLDGEEERAIRAAAAAAHPGHGFEIDLAIQSGMRRGEQWGLRWQDVDLENSIAQVEGKRGRRHVRLNGAAKNALIKLHEISNGSPFVSPDKSREDQGDFRRWFDDALEAAKVDGCCWHTMRHTFVSRLVMAGVDLVTVRSLAGHRSIQTTLRYAHLAPGHEKEAIERLARWHQNGTENSGDQQVLRFEQGARSSAG